MENIFYETDWYKYSIRILLNDKGCLYKTSYLTSREFDFLKASINALKANINEGNSYHKISIPCTDKELVQRLAWKAQNLYYKSEEKNKHVLNALKIKENTLEIEFNPEFVCELSYRLFRKYGVIYEIKITTE